MVKKILNILKLLTLTSLVLGCASAEVRTLECIYQGDNNENCAYHAAWNASCMAYQDFNDVKSFLTDNDQFNSYFGTAMHKVLANSGGNRSANLDIDEITASLLSFLPNKENISVIESQDELDAIIGGGYESFHGHHHPIISQIQNFKENGTPQAIILHRHGHWVAYGIRQEEGETKIYLTNSAGEEYKKSETIGFSGNNNDGIIGGELYYLFNPQADGEPSSPPAYQVLSPEEQAEEQATYEEEPYSWLGWGFAWLTSLGNFLLDADEQTAQEAQAEEYRGIV